ncbi:response regulator [Streptomyces sp. NPDC002888]|uniref:response regulator n=1 Tax=Streptomyces sp. NPDC002888 TaxID=3364668 RepID=UPI003689B04F
MISVAVVDNLITFCQGMRAWTGQHTPDTIRVVADSPRVGSLIVAMPEPPDVVVLDVRLHDGTKLAQNITTLMRWGTQVVVVSADDSTPEMRRVAMDNGAQSFLHKGDDFGEICHAVTEAAAGRPYVNARLAHFIYRERERIALTSRQVEVVGLLNARMRTAEVAHAMGITENTVKGYLKAIREKYYGAGCEVSTREELLEELRRDGYLGDW